MTTPWRVHTSARPQDPRRGPVRPMSQDDHRFWRIIRQRHPQYYRKENDQ